MARSLFELSRAIIEYPEFAGLDVAVKSRPRGPVSDLKGRSNFPPVPRKHRGRGSSFFGEESCREGFALSRIPSQTRIKGVCLPSPRSIAPCPVSRDGRQDARAWPTNARLFPHKAVRRPVPCASAAQSQRWGKEL